MAERSLKLSNLHKTFIMWEPCGIESYPRASAFFFPRNALSAEMRLVCPEIELDMLPDFTAVIHK